MSCSLGFEDSELIQLSLSPFPSQVIRVAQQSTSSRQFFAKRLSTIVAREARRASTRTKGVKDVQTRAKKVMREVSCSVSLRCCYGLLIRLLHLR